MKFNTFFRSSLVLSLACIVSPSLIAIGDGPETLTPRSMHRTIKVTDAMLKDAITWRLGSKKPCPVPVDEAISLAESMFEPSDNSSLLSFSASLGPQAIVSAKESEEVILGHNTTIFWIVRVIELPTAASGPRVSKHKDYVVMFNKDIFELKHDGALVKQENVKAVLDATRTRIGRGGSQERIGQNVSNDDDDGLGGSVDE